MYGAPNALCTAEPTPRPAHATTAAGTPSEEAEDMTTPIQRNHKQPTPPPPPKTEPKPTAKAEAGRPGSSKPSTPHATDTAAQEPARGAGPSTQTLKHALERAGTTSAEAATKPSVQDAVRSINAASQEVSEHRAAYFGEGGEYASKNLLQGNILDSVREATTGHRDDRHRNYDQTLQRLDHLGERVLKGEVTPEAAQHESSTIMQAYRAEDSRVRGHQIAVADTSAAVIDTVGRNGVAVTLSTVTQNPALGTLYREGFDVAAATSQRYRTALQPGFTASPHLEDRSALLLHADRLGLTGDTGAPVTAARTEAVARQKASDLFDDTVAAVTGRVAKVQTASLTGTGMSVARANLNGQGSAAVLRGGADVAKTWLTTTTDPQLTDEQRLQATQRSGVNALVGVPFAALSSFVGAKLPADSAPALLAQGSVDVTSGLLEQQVSATLTGQELSLQDRVVAASSSGLGTLNGLATHGQHLDARTTGDTPVSLWPSAARTPATEVRPSETSALTRRPADPPELLGGPRVRAVDSTTTTPTPSALPRPIDLDGQPYTLGRVNTDGTLLFVRDTPPEVYQNARQLVGARADFAGQSWQVEAVANKAVQLRGDNGARTTLSFDALKADAPDRPAFRLGNEAYHLTGVSDTGGLRFAPKVPLASDAVTLRPQDLPPFEAVLRTRAHEGPYTVVPDPQTGALRATQLDAAGKPGAWIAIEPRDLAPAYTDVAHSDFGAVKAPTTTVARDDLEVKGRAPEAGATWTRPSRESSPVISDPRIGSVSPSAELIVLPNAAAGQLLVDSVRTSRGPLVVKMKAMEEGAGVDRLVDALVERRSQRLPSGEPTPVTVVMNPIEPMLPQHQSRLERAGVRVVYPELAGQETLVVHQKSVISPTEALISTGELDPNPAKRKFELAARLTGDDARALYDYERMVAAQVNTPERAQRVEDLARRGVLINDPQAGKLTVPIAISGLIDGAKSDLTLMASHKLSSPEATEQLIRAAERGVDVRVVTQGIDPRSRGLIDEALARDPSLRLRVDIVDKKAFVHTHANIYVADGGQQAVAATAFLWPNQLRGSGREPTVPDGRSFENGLVVSGQQSRDLAAAVHELIETYTPHTVKGHDGAARTPSVQQRRLPEGR